MTEAGFEQLVRNGYAVSVQTQYQGGDALTWDRAQAKACGEGHRGKGMGGVEFAVDDLVADCCPAKLALQQNIKIEFTEEAQLLRHNQRGTIRKWHEAKPDGGFLYSFVHPAVKFHSRFRR